LLAGEGVADATTRRIGGLPGTGLGGVGLGGAAFTASFTAALAAG
jgi:hypothetical protein